MRDERSASTWRERAQGEGRRLAEMASKRRRAYRLGIVLGRSADFELASSVEFGGERKARSLSAEKVATAGFSEILFADC